MTVGFPVGWALDTLLGCFDSFHFKFDLLQNLALSFHLLVDLLLTKIFDKLGPPNRQRNFFQRQILNINPLAPSDAVRKQK